MQVDLTIKNYRCFADSDPVTVPLRKGFTALVGVNNSGKSSLLRFFFEFRNLFSLLSAADGNFVNAFNRNTVAFGQTTNVLDLQELFSNTNDRSLELHFLFSPERGEPEQREFRTVITVKRPTNTFQMQFFIGDKLFAGTVDINAKTILSSPGTTAVANIGFLFDTFSKLRDTLYVGPFRNAVNLGSKADYFDISIGQSFISTWRANKTGPTKRFHQAILKLTEDIKRIFAFKQLEINASDDNQTMQLFVDGKSYFLPELGSGLCQFIVVLASAALRKPSYILIDEPEMGLHPSLQLDFLTTLGSYATEGVIFSTHSLGLARASAERIYSVRKKEDGTGQVAQLEKTSRLSEFLGELSFSGYQELGFDKILLVEGASEVKTFQQFLRKYGSDHKVVLLPMGGSQLINPSRELELQEIKRISQNVFAVIDSERTVADEALKPDRSGFAEACKKLGINCHVLERRATENYLTERAIRLFKGNAFSALGPYQLLRNVTPAWSKEENWRIASEMTKDELDSTDLGAFLKSF
jgi:predicted ATPase